MRRRRWRWCQLQTRSLHWWKIAVIMRRRKVEVGEQVMSEARRMTHQPRRLISKELEWKEMGMVMEVWPGVALELMLQEELLD